MKGIVFTEFLEMVEEKFGFEVADQIIQNTELKSGGSYTAIGTYEHSEMIGLVQSLHKYSGIPVKDLYRTYGEYLFSSFVRLYPDFFKNTNDALSFLEQIDHYIHREVLKLYPDAELPSFQTERKSDHQLIMHYKSERRMADFAHGLIISTLKYFNAKADIDIQLLNEKETEVVFTINQK